MKPKQKKKESKMKRNKKKQIDWKKIERWFGQANDFFIFLFLFFSSSIGFIFGLFSLMYIFLLHNLDVSIIILAWKIYVFMLCGMIFTLGGFLILKFINYGEEEQTKRKEKLINSIKQTLKEEKKHGK